jgi:phosphate:Na+ symporter
VLFIIGLVAFRSGPRSRIKDIGRVFIGLGLMLLALHILLNTLAPAENAPGVRVFMNAITGDPVLCILFAAIVTWLVHSSVASVLLVMSLAYAHFITPYAALALVLGANLGSAINPIVEGARRDNPASYRLPLGNLVNRLAGILLVAPFLQPIADLLISWQPDLAKATALFHIAFNVVTAALFIGLLDGMARLLKALLPERVKEADASGPRYLDESALETPSLALADAARETLHMGDHVEIMLRKVMAAMMTNDRALVDQVSQMDNSVDSLDEAIKLYVTKLTRGSPRRARGTAGDGDRLLRHQPRAYRRHHRQESERARHQEDQAPVPVLGRGRRGAVRLPQAHDGFASDRVRRLHVRRRQRGAKAAGREGRAAQCRTGRDRTASRPPARRPARNHRDHLAASRRAARPQAHPLAHLLGRLPVLDAAGELAAYRSAESELPALPRRSRAADDQRSSVFDAVPRFFTISMMFLM